jgi:hypothetical protein
VTNLSLPPLVGPFQRLCVDGNMLNDFIESFQDLVDLDNVEIKPVLAKKTIQKPHRLEEERRKGS